MDKKEMVRVLVQAYLQSPFIRRTQEIANARGVSLIEAHEILVAEMEEGLKHLEYTDALMKARGYKGLGEMEVELSNVWSGRRRGGSACKKPYGILQATDVLLDMKDDWGNTCNAIAKNLWNYFRRKHSEHSNNPYIAGEYEVYYCEDSIDSSDISGLLVQKQDNVVIPPSMKFRTFKKHVTALLKEYQTRK